MTQPSLTMDIEGGSMQSSLAIAREAQPLFMGPGLTVDSRFRWVYLDGNKVFLSHLEMCLFCLLIERSEQVLTRDQILNEVWGVGVYVVDRVVDSHIRSLRRKLGKYRNYIVTVYGDGYSFNPYAYQNKITLNAS